MNSHLLNEKNMSNRRIILFEEKSNKLLIYSRIINIRKKYNIQYKENFQN